MNADGTLELSELRAFYLAHGRSIEQADAVYRRIHPGSWWLAPPNPTRPPCRAWIKPKTAPPCRRLEPERSTA